jgi:saccharopine dehydrogenase (NADP+, L-glutamate forming)
LQDGKVVEIANRDLMGRATPYHVMDGYSFVAYPNRNSLPFQEFYGIPEAHTVIRGSLRYDGNPLLVKALIDLGWLDSARKDWLAGSVTWAEIQQKATGAASSAEEDLVAKIDELCQLSPGSADRDKVISGLRWIGLFDQTPARTHGNLLDTLSARLERLCSFQPGERDLVILQHRFVVEWEDGSTVSRSGPLRVCRGCLGVTAY